MARRTCSPSPSPRPDRATVRPRCFRRTSPSNEPAEGVSMRARFRRVFALALLCGGLAAHTAQAQEPTTVAQSGSALFAGAPVYRGVRLSSLMFGIGGTVDGGTAFGNF